jgi:hypothetical protein
VYETVWGVSLDPRNFHRKVTGGQGFLETTGTTTTRGGGRPAALYRREHGALLHPPMLRPDGGDDWHERRDANAGWGDSRRLVTLWRPMGPGGLELIVASGYRAFPPRLPGAASPTIGMRLMEMETVREAWSPPG